MDFQMKGLKLFLIGVMAMTLGCVDSETASKLNQTESMNVDKKNYAYSQRPKTQI